MTEQVQSEVGFADSELEGYQRSASELVVRVRCWNETLLTVTFRDVLAVRDVMAGSFSAFVRQEDKSIEFLHQVIAADRGEPLLLHGYRVFSFLNDDDEPSLEIVAKACEVTNSG